MIFERIFRRTEYVKNNNSYATYQSIVFNLLIYGCYILYFLSLFEFLPSQQKFISTVRYVVSIYAGLFLIIRFNRFRKKIIFNDFDRKVAFHAGVFIVYANILQLYLVPYIKTTHLAKYTIVDKILEFI